MFGKVFAICVFFELFTVIFSVTPTSKSKCYNVENRTELEPHKKTVCRDINIPVTCALLFTCYEKRWKCEEHEELKLVTKRVGTYKCCSGYETFDRINKQSDDFTCVPVCDTPCKNANCTEPNTCTCDFGYRRSTENNYTCTPVCYVPCGNGNCTAPETCTCNEGYEERSLPMTGTYPLTGCVPVCPDGCFNGTCVAPDTCECYVGYQRIANSSNFCELFTGIESNSFSLLMLSSLSMVLLTLAVLLLCCAKKNICVQRPKSKEGAVDVNNDMYGALDPYNAQYANVRGS